MDLIQEYYDKRGHESEYDKMNETRHKKIVSWQKKIKKDANASVTSKKISKLKVKLSQSALLREKSRSRTLNFNAMANFNKMFNEALLNFDAKCDELAMSWRLTTSTPQLDESTGPIEKWDYLENKIRESFHKSYEEYFPNSTDMLDDVLNLMFQTSDNSFKKTMKVTSKQIMVVPDATAKYLNEKVSLWDKLRELIERDVKTSEKYKMLPTSAFGKTVQYEFKFKSSADDFKTKWQNYSQRNKYHQELETFASVWKNITHLQSTRKFCTWLMNNPNVVPPAFLESEGLLKENLSFDFSANSDSLYDKYVTPNEIMENPYRKTRPKTILETSYSNSSISSDSVDSVDISDINIIV